MAGSAAVAAIGAVSQITKPNLPPPPGPVPTKEDDRVSNARDDARAAARRRLGRQSTILTGPGGVTEGLGAQNQSPFARAIGATKQKLG